MFQPILFAKKDNNINNINNNRNNNITRYFANNNNNNHILPPQITVHNNINNFEVEHNTVRSEENLLNIDREFEMQKEALAKEYDFCDYCKFNPAKYKSDSSCILFKEHSKFDKEKPNHFCINCSKEMNNIELKMNVIFAWKKKNILDILNVVVISKFVKIVILISRKKIINVLLVEIKYKHLNI